MTDIEIDDMIFGMNFFGKQNFEVMTYTEYKFVEPNFVQYTLEHPKIRDVYINIKMNMFVNIKSDKEIPDVYQHINREYGDDFRMDMEEVILWLQDNEWPANYNGLDLDEVR